MGEGGGGDEKGVGVEGSSKSICVRHFSPSALSFFGFHLSPFPPETPDTQAKARRRVVPIFPQG